jgi:hypothetical protein
MATEVEKSVAKASIFTNNVLRCERKDGGGYSVVDGGKSRWLAEQLKVVHVVSEVHYDNRQ